MQKWKCDNCESEVEDKLEFCPQCGLHKDAFDSLETQQLTLSENTNKSIEPKDDSVGLVVRQMAKNIQIIKHILMFFAVLWIIGALIMVIGLTK